MSQLRVSVCIPAYRQPAFTARAVESVFSQTLQDFEIIITDDSDNDEVYQALAPWHGDSRLVYRLNESKLGSPENWNSAMTLARSGLIKFLHHDDWFAKADALERFVSVMEKNPRIDFAFSAAKACEDDGRVIFIHRPQQSQIALLREQPWALQFANFIGAPSATIFRTSSSLKFNITLRWVVDIDAYLRILGERPQFEYLSEELVCITSNGVHQVTRSVALDTVTRVGEHLFLYAHNPPRNLMGRVDGFLYLCRLLMACKLSELDSIDTYERSQHSYRIEEKMALMTVKFKMQLLKLKGNLRRKLAELRFRRNKDGRVSYSQCGEDMIVDFLFMWLGTNKISYLDIGAHHPTWLSNTYHLYKKGQRGILIEPDADLCQYIRQKRPRDQVLNLAVNTEGDDMMNLYVMTSRTLNTMDKEQALALEKAGREQIQCVREVRRLGINKILQEHFSKKAPEFVSLDIEGLDLAILQAWDFGKFRPEVFCIETLTYTQNNSEQKLNEIIELMISNKYRVYADTYVNTIFVSQDAWNKRPVYE